jgi:hypothetical protein
VQLALGVVTVFAGDLLGRVLERTDSAAMTAAKSFSRPRGRRRPRRAEQLEPGATDSAVKRRLAGGSWPGGTWELVFRDLVTGPTASS